MNVLKFANMQSMTASAAGSMPELSWPLALVAVAVTVLGVMAAELFWSRLFYDMHRIPVAPGSMPILGRLTATCQVMTGGESKVQLRVTAWCNSGALLPICA
jgi:hypothetical protein